MVLVVVTMVVVVAVVVVVLMVVDVVMVVVVVMVMVVVIVVVVACVQTKNKTKYWCLLACLSNSASPNYLLLPALLLTFQLMSSWRRRRAFAKPATPKITIYDVTEGVTLELDCHGGPMR